MQEKSSSSFTFFFVRKSSGNHVPCTMSHTCIIFCSFINFHINFLFIFINISTVKITFCRMLTKYNVVEITANAYEKVPLGKAKLIDHKIVLTYPQPIKVRTYGVLLAIQEKVDTEMKSMLQDGVMELTIYNDYILKHTKCALICDMNLRNSVCTWCSAKAKFLVQNHLEIGCSFLIITSLLIWDYGFIWALVIIVKEVILTNNVDWLQLCGRLDGKIECQNSINYFPKNMQLDEIFLILKRNSFNWAGFQFSEVPVHKKLICCSRCREWFVQGCRKFVFQRVD